MSAYSGLITLALGSLGFAGALIFIAAYFAAPKYHGPKSDHFDGKRFSNLAPFTVPGFFDVLRWKLFSQDEEWPKLVEFPNVAPPPARAVGPRITFINHSTLLIQLYGLNILTDPVFSERLGPLADVGSPRHKAPGVAFEQLPKINVVLVSHNHYDHLDLPSLSRIVERDKPVLLAGLGNRALFERAKLSGAVDLDLWQTHDVAGATFTFTPAQHWSARSIADRNRSLWGSFHIRSKNSRIYFAGDTGAGPHFAEIRTRLGAVDVALLPIGAYAPRWFMRAQHMDAAEAVDAHLALHAKTSIATHFGCFDLSDEGMLEPVELLARALESRKVASSSFLVLEHGESFAPAP